MQHGAFDDENEMVMGAIMSDIADQLLDDIQIIKLLADVIAIISKVDLISFMI